jgi:hypothetical protein
MAETTLNRKMRAFDDEVALTNRKPLLFSSLRSIIL